MNSVYALSCMHACIIVVVIISFFFFVVSSSSASLTSSRANVDQWGVQVSLSDINLTQDECWYSKAEPTFMPFVKGFKTVSIAMLEIEFCASLMFQVTPFPPNGTRNLRSQLNQLCEV